MTDEWDASAVYVAAARTLRSATIVEVRVSTSVVAKVRDIIGLLPYVDIEDDSRKRLEPPRLTPSPLPFRLRADRGVDGATGARARSARPSGTGSARGGGGWSPPAIASPAPSGAAD